MLGAEAISGAQAGVFGGILLALLGIVKLFITAMDAHREQTFTFLNNHMSSNTKALRDTAVVLTELVEQVKEMRREMR